MKVFKSILVIILACVLLCGCEAKNDTGYAEGYEVGYEEGYYVGLEEGENDAKAIMEYRYEKISTSEVEEAFSILGLYADEGMWADPTLKDSISEKELKWAAETVSYFWHDIEELSYE